MKNQLYTNLDTDEYITDGRYFCSYSVTETTTCVTETVESYTLDSNPLLQLDSACMLVMVSLCNIVTVLHGVSLLHLIHGPVMLIC